MDVTGRQQSSDASSPELGKVAGVAWRMGDEVRSDEETRQNEEDVDADVAAAEAIGPQVEQEDERNRESTRSPWTSPRKSADVRCFGAVGGDWRCWAETESVDRVSITAMPRTTPFTPICKNHRLIPAWVFASAEIARTRGAGDSATREPTGTASPRPNDPSASKGGATACRQNHPPRLPSMASASPRGMGSLCSGQAAWRSGLCRFYQLGNVGRPRKSSGRSPFAPNTLPRTWRN